MKYPNFFIIGAAKSGTSSMAAWLHQHPTAFISPIKEPHHYNSDHDLPTYHSREKYLSLFEGAYERHLAVGEASPGYLFSDVAVPRILDDVPKAKIIVMLRNPIEMAIAAHAQLLRNGDETILRFREAWELREERRQGRRVPRFCRDKAFLDYEKFCSVGQQLLRVTSTVPAEQLLVVFLEDIKNDPRKIWLEVLAFLGLPDDGRTEFPAVNTAMAPRSLLLVQVHSFHNWLRRKYRFPDFNTGLLNKLNAVNMRKIRAESIDRETKFMLAEAFKNDIALLSVIVQRDLSHWVDGSLEEEAPVSPAEPHALQWPT